jgi:hypothetical protein
MSNLKYIVATLFWIVALYPSVARGQTPIDVTYTVSGTSGAWILDFSVTNHLNVGQDVYLWGVFLPAQDVVASPAGWTNNCNPSACIAGTLNTGSPLPSGITLNGPNITFNNLWVNGVDAIASGDSLSGFEAEVNSILPPTSVEWFAIGADYSPDGTAPYTGGGEFMTSGDCIDVFGVTCAVQDEENPGFAGTAYPTQTATLSAAGGSFNLGWPPGCNVSAASPPCNFTFGITYPAGMYPQGATAAIAPTDTSQATWASRTPPGNPFAGTQIAPVAGQNGDGIIYSASCTYAGASCPPPANFEDFVYTVSTTWMSSQVNYCGSSPGLLKADPIGSDNWVDTLVSCTEISPDPTYGNKGSSNCTSSSCLSDWANVFDIGGPIASSSAASINFGNVPVGKLAAQILTLTNIGSKSLSISNIRIAPVPGGDSDDFLFLPLCPGTLGAGRSCVVVLGFFADADDFNPQSATLTITDNALNSPQLVPLTAQVVPRH